MIKDPLKIISKKSFLFFHSFFGNIIVHIQDKYQTNQIKLRESIWFEKSWRTTKDDG